jgi:SAM-dependent methyltransferase
MDFAVYVREAEIEATHWWFVGRRKLIADELTAAGIGPQCRALDVGTGTGSNLRLLRELRFREAEGVDSSETAIRFCRQHGYGPMHHADICDLPFAEAQFDLVLATDVIEHVDDDAKAAGELLRVLKPGGLALVTVPAFQTLWGRSDEIGQHKRRYRLASLRALLESAGFRIEKIYYFNYLLFPVILTVRRAMGFLKLRIETENDLNSPLLNRLLGGIFSLDVRTAPIIRPPFGVSILAACRRVT